MSVYKTITQRTFGSRRANKRTSTPPALAEKKVRSATSNGLFQGHQASEPQTPPPAETGSTQQTTSTDGPTWTKPVRIPPLFIDKSIPDWPKLATSIEQRDPGAQTFYRGSSYRVKASSLEGFRALQKLLFNTGVPFHTFLTRKQRQVKVVISGLPDYVTEDDILQELQGFPVELVTRLRSRRGDTKLWFVTLENIDDEEELLQAPEKIFKIKRLCHVQVEIKAYRRPPGPPQCYRCQLFGHGSSLCNRPLRCVRCGEPHRRQDCTRDKEEPGKCCNCGEAHNASYRGCKSFAAACKKLQPRKQAPRRSEAATRPKTLAEQVPPPEEPVSEGGEDEPMEGDFTVVTRKKKKKRQPRNPENRGPKSPRTEPKPTEPEPALPFRLMPLPEPRRPSRPAVARQTEAAATEPQPATESGETLTTALALLAEITRQLTALTGLLTTLLPQLQKPTA